MWSPNALAKQESHALLLRGLLSPHGFVAGSDAESATAGHAAARQPLPLVQLFTRSSGCGSFIATTSVDDRGALTDRAAVREIGWAPGTPVQITMIPTAGVIVIRRNGSDTVTSKGHIRLPARIRHRLRLEAGDRLLLLALVNDGVLLAYLGSAIDQMATAFHEGITEPEIR